MSQLTAAVPLDILLHADALGVDVRLEMPQPLGGPSVYVGGHALRPLACRQGERYVLHCGDFSDVRQTVVANAIDEDRAPATMPPSPARGGGRPAHPRAPQHWPCNNLLLLLGNPDPSDPAVMEARAGLARANLTLDQSLRQWALRIKEIAAELGRWALLGHDLAISGERLPSTSMRLAVTRPPTWTDGDTALLAAALFSETQARGEHGAAGLQALSFVDERDCYTPAVLSEVARFSGARGKAPCRTVIVCYTGHGHTDISTYSVAPRPGASRPSTGQRGLSRTGMAQVMSECRIYCHLLWDGDSRLRLDCERLLGIPLDRAIEIVCWRVAVYDFADHTPDSSGDRLGATIDDWDVHFAVAPPALGGSAPQGTVRFSLRHSRICRFYDTAITPALDLLTSQIERVPRGERDRCGFVLLGQVGRCRRMTDTLTSSWAPAHGCDRSYFHELPAAGAAGEAASPGGGFLDHVPREFLAGRFRRQE